MKVKKRRHSGCVDGGRCCLRVDSHMSGVGLPREGEHALKQV